MTSLLLKKVTPDLVDLDQIKWIEQDVLFDLMFEICNVLYENDLRATSFQLELALDAFLLETSRAFSAAKVETSQTRHVTERRAKSLPMRRTTGATRSRLNGKRTKRPRLAEQEDKEVDNIFSDLWDDLSDLRSNSSRTLQRASSN